MSAATPPVHVSRRTFVGGAESEVGAHRSVGSARERQGWRHGIAHPDHDVAPGHLVAIAAEAHAEGPLELFAAESGGGRVDLGLRRRHGIGVHLGPNGRVDQVADRLRQRLVDATQPFDVLGVEVLHWEVKHT